MLCVPSLNLQSLVLLMIFSIKRVVLGAVSAPPGQLYGLEKFWAFLKYSKIKNQPIDPKLQEHLSQFKNLEDFRVVVSVQKMIDMFLWQDENSCRSCNDSDLCVCSPRWERREAGGDVTRPRPGMKEGVGDILPTLPQNPRRPPNPPPLLPLLHRKTHPKKTPRKHPPPPPRGRRPPSLERRRGKVLRQINEAPPPPVGVGVG